MTAPRLASPTPLEGADAELRAHLRDARRVVVKTGTNVLIAPDGTPSLGHLYTLVESLASLRRRGLEVVLVSSGAVGMGMRHLGFTAKPTETAVQQACAAVGQCELMAIYQTGFGRLGVVSAQVLLSQEDFEDGPRRTNLRGTLERLLQLGVVPIVNENDTVATAELERLRFFGDNDKLSALVAAGLQADALLILTDVDGVYTGNPHKDPSAQLIPAFTQVTDETLAMAAGTSSRGRGGMSTKLDAARHAMNAGVTVVIASGHPYGIVGEILDGRPHGTIFAPTPRPAGTPG